MNILHLIMISNKLTYHFSHVTRLFSWQVSKPWQNLGSSNTQYSITKKKITIFNRASHLYTRPHGLPLQLALLVQEVVGAGRRKDLHHRIQRQLDRRARIRIPPRDLPTSSPSSTTPASAGRAGRPCVGSGNSGRRRWRRRRRRWGWRWVWGGGGGGCEVEITAGLGEGFRRVLGFFGKDVVVGFFYFYFLNLKAHLWNFDGPPIFL